MGMLYAALAAVAFVCTFRLTIALMNLQNRQIVPGSAFLIEAALTGFAAYVIAGVIPG